MKIKWALLLTILVSLFHSAVADADGEMVITPKGYGSFEFGQMGHGFYRKGQEQIYYELSHITQERSFANVGLTARYEDILEIDLVGEGMIAFSYPQIGAEPTTMQPRTYYYIKSSNAKLMFGDPSTFGFNLQVGYFPFKYNSDVRNLGENLFRSSPYPTVIYADFDYPMATLLGLRLNTVISDSLFSNDLLFHSEMITHPVQNWSLSDVASLNLFNMVTLGGGISLYHWFSAYQSKDLDGSANQYYHTDDLSEDKKIELGIDDSISYSAVKLMGRIAIDIKQILDNFDIVSADQFGSNDLRLYSELNINGLDNYSGEYEDIADRIFWSFGINIPGFNIVDLINLEMEYCKNGTAFSDSRFYDDKPTLIPDSLGSDPTSLNGDRLVRAPWRWSVYIKKTFLNEHLNVIAQIARDHKKLNFYYFRLSHMSFAEVLPTKKDWWWVLKTEYKF